MGGIELKLYRELVLHGVWRRPKGHLRVGAGARNQAILRSRFVGGEGRRWAAFILHPHHCFGVCFANLYSVSPLPNHYSDAVLPGAGGGVPNQLTRSAVELVGASADHIVWKLVGIKRNGGSTAAARCRAEWARNRIR